MNKPVDANEILAELTELLEMISAFLSGLRDGDSDIILAERLESATKLGIQLYFKLNPSRHRPGDYSDIDNANLLPRTAIALKKTCERLGRLYCPTNFTDQDGRPVDPNTAPDCFFYWPPKSEWEGILRPAWDELSKAMNGTCEITKAKETGISAIFEQAYLSYEFGIDQLGRNASSKEVWNYLHENPFEGYSLPGIDTWQRYVRKGRQYYSTQKNSPRASRISRSVVRHNEI